MKTIMHFSYLAVQLLLAVSVSGQSSFWLQNRFVIDAPVFNAQGAPLAGTNFLVELWGGATSDSLQPALNINQGSQRLIIPFLNNPSGYFSSSEAYLSIVTVPPFGWAWLQVRAWDARLGSTYEQVAALAVGGYGESALFYAQGSNPLALPAWDPAPLLGLQSFSLRPYVPEPSGLSLLLLGGAVTWCMRKKWR